MPSESLMNNLLDKSMFSVLQIDIQLLGSQPTRKFPGQIKMKPLCKRFKLPYEQSPLSQLHIVIEWSDWPI